MLSAFAQAQELKEVLLVSTLNGKSVGYEFTCHPKFIPSGSDVIFRTDDTEIVFAASDYVAFRILSEKEWVSVSGVKQDAPLFNVRANMLCVRRISPGISVSVYSSDGKLIGTGVAGMDGDASINMASSPKGVYVVKMDECTFKFLKK